MSETDRSGEPESSGRLTLAASVLYLAVTGGGLWLGWSFRAASATAMVLLVVIGLLVLASLAVPSLASRRRAGDDSASP